MWINIIKSWNQGCKLVVKSSALLWLFVFVASCAHSPPLDPIDSKIYSSGSVYTYQPLNPTTIWIDIDNGDAKSNSSKIDITSQEFKDALLKDLGTETVRISLNRVGGEFKNTIGTVGASVEGESYTLIVDYIKYISSNKKIQIDYRELNSTTHKLEKKKYVGIVPVYLGVGLRIRAEFVAHKSGLNISGLPALAIAASTNGISGSLTVQTLGITGQEITALMPIISDISISSIQNAVQAVAAIKAKIYDDKTIVYPNIIGFESPSQYPGLTKRITEILYASEEWICPKVITVTDGKKTKQKIQIYWCGNNEKQKDVKDEKKQDAKV